MAENNQTDQNNTNGCYSSLHTGVATFIYFCSPKDVIM